MSDALLILANVESAYGPVRAIRGVSLSVPKGSIVTVLGANGAGKTTILKTISGIIDPQKGSIHFKGEAIDRKEPAEIVRRGICHVPEGREVFPLLSVYDNLVMGAYTRRDADGIRRDMEMVYNYFPILKERVKQDAGLLSGGQQQMLAISRAIMGQPEMMLLDEPSLGLSPKLTQEIFDIIVRINRERGTTMLMVEQNASMALGIAEYGYVLEVGRIVMEDTCARLREKDDIKEFFLGVKDVGERSRCYGKRQQLTQTKPYSPAIRSRRCLKTRCNSAAIASRCGIKISAYGNLSVGASSARFRKRSAWAWPRLVSSRASALRFSRTQLRNGCSPISVCSAPPAS